jgi:membrane protein YdbS with pleckstrin-like domain
MKPVVIHPDRKYISKLYVVVTLFYLATFASWGVPSAYVLGNELDGALLGVILAAAVVVVPLALALPFVPVYYNSLRYELHPDEVIVYAGIVTRSVKHVPFRTVTNLKISRGPIDRFFGLGSLAIQTAGMSGTTGAEENLVGLLDVQGIYEQIAGELRRFRGALSPTQTDDEHAPAPVGESQTLNAILDELRAVRTHLEQS